MLSATIATISARISVLIPLVDRNRDTREGLRDLSAVPGTFWVADFISGGMTIHRSKEVRPCDSQSSCNVEGIISVRLRFLSPKFEAGDGFCPSSPGRSRVLRDRGAHGSELPKPPLLGPQPEIENALRIDCPDRFTMEASSDETVSDFLGGGFRNAEDEPEARETGEPEIER